MKKIMISLLCVLLALLVFIFVGIAPQTEQKSSTPLDTSRLLGNYDVPELRGTSINVYNWGEYSSDGSEGSVDVVTEFQKLTGITVHYTMFASNEDLYAKLKSGGVSYDVIFPSDYMIERMINENLLQKIDFNNVPNYRFMPENFKDLYFDPTNEYSVPYTGGMVGIIYNSKMVEEVPDSWSVLWDERYTDNILNFNNPRDAFGTAQYLLGYSVNSTNPEEWEAAAQKLIEQKPLIQSYVMDEIFVKMESGEAAIAPYYAGDYLSMADVNPDLCFVYPKEGTNMFVDSMCIPYNSKNKAAAELFINFMCEPEVALQNAEYLCYLCPNTAVQADDRYTYKGNPVLYPEVPVQTEYYHNLDRETLDRLFNLWEKIKLA